MIDPEIIITVDGFWMGEELKSSKIILDMAIEKFYSEMVYILPYTESGKLSCKYLDSANSKGFDDSSYWAKSGYTRTNKRICWEKTLVSVKCEFFEWKVSLKI